MSQAERTRRWIAKNPHKRREYTRKYSAAKLARGEQIRDYSNHHKGMAELKGPRPEGMELSLINFDSPDAYWGHHARGPHRLSTNPDDYAWETRAENEARKGPR